MDTYFRDKMIWITGASSGIGEALALLLAEKGAHLVLSGRDKEKLTLVSNRCALFGASEKPIVEAFNMAEHAAFPEIVENVLRLTGKIDILINNAGVGQRASALSCAPEVLQRVMNVNFFGTVFLTQAVIPSMIERGSGRIVVVSSVLGKFHLPGRSAYSASKHAVRGYFDTLRAELHGSGVEISVVYPGWIATHISQNALTADGTAYNRTTGVAADKMTAEECARRIAAAITAGKREASMGGIETLGGIFRALCPAIYDWSTRMRSREFMYSDSRPKGVGFSTNFHR